MKLKSLVLLLSVFILTLSLSIFAFASNSEYEYFTVTNDGKINYGYLTVYGDDVNVIYCLMTNGTQQAFIPIIYSTSNSEIEIEYGYASKNGTTIDAAKNLSRDNMEMSFITDTVIFNDVYIYNTWDCGLFGYSNQMTDIYTNDDKYYFYNSNYDVLSQDMVISAFSKYSKGELYGFDIVNGNEYVSNEPVSPPSNISNVNLFDCINVIISMIYRVCDVLMLKPFVYFLVFGIIIGGFGLFSKFKNSI